MNADTSNNALKSGQRSVVVQASTAFCREHYLDQKKIDMRTSYSLVVHAFEKDKCSLLPPLSPPLPGAYDHRHTWYKSYISGKQLCFSAHSPDWIRIRTGPDVQIQCILSGKQQHPDCAVRIAVKRALGKIQAWWLSRVVFVWCWGFCNWHREALARLSDKWNAWSSFNVFGAY